MGKYKIKIGIIAGCGLDKSFKEDLTYFSKIEREDATNEYGLPSSSLYTGTISGVDVVLLIRHGSGYKVSATDVNYRANIEAFRVVGCTHILATTACGSLVKLFSKEQLVIPDSFIDRTVHRKGTFYDGTSKYYSGICNLPMEPSFDPHTSQIVENAAKKLEISIKKGATIVAIEGPRFSSKAESYMFRQWGGHLINMTTCPEVFLAKEAGILYTSIAMVTDYDCGSDDIADNVHPVDVFNVFKRNINKIKSVLIQTIELISQEDWDQRIDDLKVFYIDLVKSSVTLSS
ncbi:PREDICTED: S-methyl-5'-thioadenosine phosphorylase [Ceratosolen solmsi marchali]|uniref:Purine nucleoside phosphorylase n=1 Tax=Ceratosolen solmsi marchali TaxID=326594 RepID=A0AAJ7E1U1_9HYME|nr:PREDICTED: S-methyl-5'-thioadenosine phosphorylase [Ceratosolen solmsi marchali]